MPKQRKRRFIDPKKSVTFEVVPRSQVDPLIADERAPKNVLLEKKTRRVLDIDDRESSKPQSRESRLEEQRKYGIYFDDDYNYLQHLRDVKQVNVMEPIEVYRVDRDGPQVKLNLDIVDEDEDDEKPEVIETKQGPSIILPSSVFASTVEERVGLLHKNVANTGPRLDWDPDVMAALDDDYEADDSLEDDFVALASGGKDCIEDLGAGDKELSSKMFYYTEGNDDDDYDDEDGDMFGCSDGEYDEEDESGDEVGGLKRFDKEETKTKFTNYSLSSSVMTRTGGLKTIDDQFEKMFEEYDDREVGALDGEDIEGNIAPESRVVSKLADQYEEMKKMCLGTIDDAIGVPEQRVKKKALEVLDRVTEDMEELKVYERDPQEEQKWDCESILSTYSNIYNRPKIIELPKKVKLTSGGMPVEDQPGLTKKALKQLEGDFMATEDYAKSVCSRASAVSVARPKDETPEERKLRKQQVKEFRKERRMEKKANALAFKAEEYRQKMTNINVKNNQGIKLH